jgi:hypothetical protein
LRVERGIPSSSDRLLSREVIVLLCLATLVRIRIWLSLRVRRIRLRRSETPSGDIGVDALPTPAPKNRVTTF